MIELIEKPVTELESDAGYHNVWYYMDRIREQKGISKHDLAKLLGRAPQSVHNWIFHDRQKIDMTDYLIFCLEMDIPLDLILTRMVEDRGLDKLYENYK